MVDFILFCGRFWYEHGLGLVCVCVLVLCCERALSMHTIELKLSARYCCINCAKLLIYNAFALNQKLFCSTPHSIRLGCIRWLCVCVFFSFIISMMWNAKENLWFTHYTIWLMECTETMHRTQNVSQMLWEQCLNTLSFIKFKHLYVYIYISVFQPSTITMIFP